MTSHSHNIRHFVPAAEGEELAFRISLLKARDYAAALVGRTVSRRAYDLARDAHEIAGAFVYAEDSSKLLEPASRCCRYLVMAAVLAEQLDNGRGDQ